MFQKNHTAIIKIFLSTNLTFHIDIEILRMSVCQGAASLLVN